MRKIHFDCALIFALEEEYNIINDYQEIKIESGLKHFNFFDKKGLERKCVVDYVAKPSVHNAYKFCQKFLETISYEKFFVIGLSGQLSDDIRLGDIVIANHIDLYDYEQKFKGGDLKLSGDVIKFEGHSNQLEQLNTIHKIKIDEWKSNSHKVLNELLEQQEIKELEDKCFIWPKADINFKYGRIAVGSSVVDDSRIKDRILAKDRKLLCVDMESFGFADAFKKNNNLFIIRAVCDTADGRKKELDKFSSKPDSLRKWALNNAFYLFQNILLSDIEFTHDSGKCAYKTRVNKTIESFTNTHGREAFEVYSQLYHEITLKINKDKTSCYQLFIDNIQNSKNNPLVVKGLPGSGKTTLLYSCYKYLNNHGINCNYIDLHFYKKSRSNSVIQTFKSDLEVIIKDEVAKVLVIDGIDEYERFFKNREVSISGRWKEISERYENIILGITKQDFENEEDERRQYYIREPNTLLTLTNFTFNEKNKDWLIKNLLCINNEDPERFGLIKAFFEKTNIKEIDWHTANLIVKNIGKFHYDNINSLGELFHRFAHNFFADKKIPEQRATKKASDLAFSKYIKEERLDQTDYESEQWIFIQQSNTVKQFLISEHLILQYISLKEEFKKSIEDLNYVYSFKINSYFKDNLNRSKKIQKQVFESVTSKYKDLTIIQRPNVCYILGRLELSVLKIESTKFLKRQLENERKDFENNVYKDDISKFRQHLLLIRTISISLVYQGEKSASDDYIKSLLTNSQWDDLNRGFHMEYYGDKKYDPTKLGLHKDDLNLDFLNTYRRLSQRIRQFLRNSESATYLMFDIELQTITSLAVNRFISGKLKKNIIDDVSSLLFEILNHDNIRYCNNFLKSFIALSHYIITKNKTSISSILEDIYQIKTIKRSGWNFKGYRGNSFIERVVSNSESVADHTFGALIIAVLFLPNDYSQYGNVVEKNEYSKNDILKMILIHDLAEAFTGDIITFNKGELEDIAEDEQMRILLSMNILNGFGDFTEYLDLWEDFETKRTINGRVANDIDKIENYFQLQLYKKDSENVLSDFEDWASALKRSIKSPLGQDILNRLS